MIPNFIRHYHLIDKEPFLNLSDLSEEERAPIVQELKERKVSGETHRGYPDWYFVQRKEAEQNLRKAFIAKGGKPQRQSPHYFTLGRSIGYEWMYKDKFQTIDILLSAIKSELYFSIGDTLWTFARSHNPEVTFEKKWFQGKLFTYEETSEIIKELELDLEDHDSVNSHNIFVIECFIWSDEELSELQKEAFSRKNGV
jgi:hypothetical protein